MGLRATESGFLQGNNKYSSEHSHDHLPQSGLRDFPSATELANVCVCVPMTGMLRQWHKVCKSRVTRFQAADLGSSGQGLTSLASALSEGDEL